MGNPLPKDDSNKLSQMTSVFGGKNKSLTVGTAAVLAEVTTGAARNVLNLQHYAVTGTTAKVYYGFNASVTIANGHLLPYNQLVSLQVTSNVTVYLISDTVGQDVRISELL